MKPNFLMIRFHRRDHSLIIQPKKNKRDDSVRTTVAQLLSGYSFLGKIGFSVLSLFLIEQNFSFQHHSTPSLKKITPPYCDDNFVKSPPIFKIL